MNNSELKKVLNIIRGILLEFGFIEEESESSGRESHRNSY
jgi:hypothetical protein